MSSLVLPEQINPVHARFRELEVPEAFSWQAGVQETALSGLYAVAFRSQRNLTAGAAKITCLLELDYEAFEEAKLMPGFITYWHDDDLSAEGHGLSFCLWDSKTDAKNAAQQPKHHDAVLYARGEGREVYHSYDIETFNIYRFAGGSVIFESAA
jgi:heme-degrading monooxygenase HmoA